MSASVLTKLCQLHFPTFAILKPLRSNSKYSSCCLIWVIISNTLLFRWLILFYPTCAKGRLRYWSHHTFVTHHFSVFVPLTRFSLLSPCRKRGAIINMSSSAGLLPTPQIAAYAATKVVYSFVFFENVTLCYRISARSIKNSMRIGLNSRALLLKGQ